MRLVRVRSSRASLGVLLALALVGCAGESAARTVPDQPAPAATVREFEDATVYGRQPLALLDALVATADRHAWVTFAAEAPEDWIGKRHVPALLARLTSTRPCAIVLGSDGVPPFDQKGTEGQVAAYLVACARGGRFPIGTGSGDPAVDVDPARLREWWARAQTEPDGNR